MADLSTIRAWEQAEIARSRDEAGHASAARLATDEAIIRRYARPPADTPFPLEYAYHLLGDVTGQTVLDYGCGDGENTVLLGRRGARIIALDVSEALLGLARNRLATDGSRPPLFLAGSAHEIPLPSSSADVVFGIAILHHLDLDRASAEVRRVLKPGGRAIFQEPVRDSRMLKIVRGLIPYRGADVSDFERQLNTADIKRFSEGFAIRRDRFFSLPFINLAQVLPWGRRHLDRLYRLDGGILARAPFLRRYAGIRVFELVKSG